jgi:hypothetical protein
MIYCTLLLLLIRQSYLLMEFLTYSVPEGTLTKIGDI